MTTFLLCILWMIGGLVIGGIAGVRLASSLVAASIRAGRMRAIIDDYEAMTGINREEAP